MADIEVTINSNVDEVLRELDKRIPVALEAVGITAEAYAKKLTPVKTGTLRNSITHTVVGDTVYIGTNVEYAPYIELGTVHYTGKHMLKRAATEHSEVYASIIKRILQGGQPPT